jgi:hypothetical protein
MYFDNHHKFILDQMNASYRSSVAAIEGAPELGIISHLYLPKDSNHPQDVRDVRQYHGFR